MASAPFPASAVDAWVPAATDGVVLVAMMTAAVELNNAIFLASLRTCICNIAASDRARDYVHENGC